MLMILFIPALVARIATMDQRYDAMRAPVRTIPYSETALVFGAGVMSNGEPTPYLKNRVASSVDLYKAGRVDQLLMSGDNSSDKYDEPTVMRDYAVKLGVPSSAIQLDYAGYSTYDSCYRAKSVFKLQQITVVTQGYHLPRAVITCERLGFTTVGVAAKRNNRDWTASYVFRENISTWKASVQLLFKPRPMVD